MVRQTETPPDVESSGPSLRTLAVIAVGAVMAVGAAFFVRPSPKLDDKGTVVAPVVPAAVMNFAATRGTPAPGPVEPPAPPAKPALSPEQQQLAKLMSQPPADAAAAVTRSVKLGPAPAAPPSPTPGVSSFAPAPEQAPAVQALASLGQPPAAAAAAAEEALKRQMADEAANAIREGDILAARKILQKSLAAGDQAAMMALAETYDPIVLSAMKVETATGDLQKARELYEKARDAGVKDARKRLAALKRYERRH